MKRGLRLATGDLAAPSAPFYVIDNLLNTLVPLFRECRGTRKRDDSLTSDLRDLIPRSSRDCSILE